MKDIDAIRRENMMTLENEAGGPTAAASRLGWDYPQWSNLRSGAADSKTGKPRGMRKDTARRIEVAFDRLPGWLDTDHSVATKGPEASIPSTTDYALIPQYSAKGACGPAYHNGHVEVRGGLAFKRDWLARMGLKPEALSAIAATGDSMSPTLSDGEVLLIDHSQTEPRDGQVFALERAGELVVKRLVRDFTDGWIVRSDNPDKTRHGDARVADTALRVVGRVVWRGGGVS